MQKTAVVTKDRYRLNFHISAPAGWINDPNGFSYFKGYYHIFYQYYPYSAERGPMHWGHYRSKDLIHWEKLPIALTPGDKEDKDGCFSGSAIVKDGLLYLLYTGHHYYKESDHSHFYQTQNVAYSADGINFKKYEGNPVIAIPPADNTQHFRDPKVWQHDQDYYLILGSQNKEKLGRVLTYKSHDLLKWKYLGPIANSRNIEEEGYMWECPDLFPLNNQDILLCSPQGIKASGKKYLNLYQTGYFNGKMDYRENKFRHGAFKELDHGHDFYAAQTMHTPDNRRILIGWLDMWNAQFCEQADGWAGTLTLPRELTWKNNQVFMQPVRELKKLRKELVINKNRTTRDEKIIVPDTQHVELLLKIAIDNWKGQTISLYLKTNQQTLLCLSWNKETNEVVVQRFDRPSNDAKRFGKLKKNTFLKIHAIIDTSAVEFFLNDGELVFSERYYTEERLKLSFEADQKADVKILAYTLGN